MNRQSNQMTIYVGLTDRETGKQKYDNEKYIAILKKVCLSYHVVFSSQLINGCYYHEDGRFVEENTLALMMIDVPEQTVIEIAKDLCAFFNQESVMITSSPTNIIFVKEQL